MLVRFATTASDVAKTLPAKLAHVRVNWYVLGGGNRKSDIKVEVVATEVIGLVIQLYETLNPEQEALKTFLWPYARVLDGGMFNTVGTAKSPRQTKSPLEN
jgi:hypothetical protein